MTAGLKLYGTTYSTCMQNALVVAQEHNLHIEVMPIDLSKGEHKSAEFLKMQPFGQIPVLVDGETTIFGE